MFRYSILLHHAPIFAQGRVYARDSFTFISRRILVPSMTLATQALAENQLLVRALNRVAARYEISKGGPHFSNQGRV